MNGIVWIDVISYRLLWCGMDLRSKPWCLPKTMMIKFSFKCRYIFKEDFNLFVIHFLIKILFLFSNYTLSQGQKKGTKLTLSIWDCWILCSNSLCMTKKIPILILGHFNCDLKFYWILLLFFKRQNWLKLKIVIYQLTSNSKNNHTIFSSTFKVEEKKYFYLFDHSSEISAFCLFWLVRSFLMPSWKVKITINHQNQLW